MSLQAPVESFFEGLSPEERDQLAGALENRSFPRGSVILAEGDAPRDMYIIRSGTADIYIGDQMSPEQRLSTVGPGDSIGEMSMLTGQPVSATVQAASDVEVLVLPVDELDRVFAEFPQLYRNLGAILSTRLARTNLRAVRQRRGEIVLLVNRGAPPSLGYALSCSVAWHSRKSTLYVGLANAELEHDLHAAIEQRPASSGGQGDDPGAHALLTVQDGRFAPEHLRQTLEGLRDQYAYILVEVESSGVPPELDAIRIEMGDSELSADSSHTDARFVMRAWTSDERLSSANRERVLSVPRLNANEIDSLTTGYLPTDHPAGRALGWAAREIADLKVGLALGAGGIKGYAHIGVLRVLERMGIPIDYVAGTSIGAAVAASYAVGFGPDTCGRILDRVGSSAFRLTVPRHGLLSNAGLRRGLQHIARDRHIEETRIPLAVVAVDINSGREIVFNQGLMWPAILASVAIPGIYPSVQIGPHTLVDGGVLNPVPSSAVTSLGADVVIAVKLARRATESALYTGSRTPGGGGPSLIQTLTRSLEIMQGKIVSEAAAAATITIEPQFAGTVGWGLRSFGDGESFIAAGEAAAEASIPRLTAALPWLRSATLTSAR